MVEKNTFTPNENRNRSTVHGRKKNVDDDRFDKKIMIRIKCVF